MAQAWQRLAGASLLLGALLASPGARAQKVLLIGVPRLAFGFDELESKEDIEPLVQTGQLVKVHLWPIMLGGKEEPGSVTYLPPEAAEAHAAIVGDLRRFLGVVNENEMEILPECAGGSIVPVRIRFRARHKQGGPVFDRVLEVWHQKRLTPSGSARMAVTSCLAPAAMAEQPRLLTRPPDFSAVTSEAAADARASDGRLVKIQLFPAELGGPDVPQNIAWLPPEEEEGRQRLIAKLKRLAEQGQLGQLEVFPEYKGESLIPSRIRYVARRGGGAQSEDVVEIW